MTQKSRLLLVEDEPSLARVVQHSLEMLGYLVELAQDGERAYNLFRNSKFELCIVDVMLPGSDGFAVARQIRANNTSVPILFLTARTADEDVLEGFRSGGNDYLKKPFNLEELFFRVNELLRRNNSSVTHTDENFRIGRYSFLPNKQTLRFDDCDEVKLSNRESALLHMFYLSRNSILDRKTVLLTLWGEDTFFNARTMDVFVTKLRKHLRQDTTIEILNIRRRGFKLIC